MADDFAHMATGLESPPTRYVAASVGAFDTTRGLKANAEITVTAVDADGNENDQYLPAGAQQSGRFIEITAVVAGDIADLLLCY